MSADHDSAAVCEMIEKEIEREIEQEIDREILSDDPVEDNCSSNGKPVDSTSAPEFKQHSQ